MIANMLAQVTSIDDRKSANDRTKLPCTAADGPITNIGQAIFGIIYTNKSEMSKQFIAAI